MTWNPHKLRWEGNESILNDFDAPSPCAGINGTGTGTVRPALITHYTPSASDRLHITDPTAFNKDTIAGGVQGEGISGISSGTGTGTGTAATGRASLNPGLATVRIVGDMKFDPEKMCWVSLVPEEDAFEGWGDGDADDEESDTLSFTGAGAGAGAGVGGRKLVSVGGQHHAQSGSVSVSGWSRMTSTTTTTTTTSSTSTFDGGDGAGTGGFTGTGTGPGAAWAESTEGGLLSKELLSECKAAEERHRKEIKGWCVRPIRDGGDVRERERREERRLWDIRNLAMRS